MLFEKKKYVSQEKQRLDQEKKRLRKTGKDFLRRQYFRC